MDLTQIPVGIAPPYDVHAVIEIPQGGIPVKYELDKKSGALFVDRFLHTSMYYPGNYGFIPQTLGADGDPVDVVVVGQVPVVPGVVIRCRPIGALLMEDEAGGDEKIVAVPHDKLHPFYTGVQSYNDLPKILTEQIAHFFEHYKDLEKGKWVTVSHWVGPEDAAQLIRDGIARVQGLTVQPRGRAAKDVTHKPARRATDRSAAVRAKKKK
jgi:inorganic pyrophosphatase